MAERWEYRVPSAVQRPASYVGAKGGAPIEVELNRLDCKSEARAEYYPSARWIDKGPSCVCRGLYCGKGRGVEIMGRERFFQGPGEVGGGGWVVLNRGSVKHGPHCINFW